MTEFADFHGYPDGKRVRNYVLNLLQAKKDSIPECGTNVFVLTTAEYWSKEYAKPEIIECVVTTHRLIKDGGIKFSVHGRWSDGNYYKASFGKTSIGKTVFLSRKEAEAALTRKEGKRRD